MKALALAAALLFAPLAAHAACAPTDFAVKDFKPAAAAGGHMALPGNVVNNCAAPSAPQVRVDIKDDSGKVIASKEAWPAGTSNIAPGQSVHFDLGRLIRVQPNMSSYTVSVVSVRTW